MKRHLFTAITSLGLVIALAGCYEGYTGRDGAMLKQYLPVEKMKELVDNPRPDIWIVDVRPESAFKSGHIPGARNFPSRQILDRLAEIPKEQYLLLTCETGGRAQIVARRLEKAGYTRFMNWGGNSRYFDVYGMEK